MADTPCAHERITTASAEGLPSLWYCDDCRRRFYPACETCVDVGHRNETHVQPAPEAGAEITEASPGLAVMRMIPAYGGSVWKICPTGYVPEDHAVRLCKCAAPAPDTAARDRETREAFWAEHRCGDTAAHLAWLRDGDRLARAIEAALPCEDPEEDCDADGRDDHGWCDYCIARAVTGLRADAIIAALEAHP